MRSAREWAKEIERRNMYVLIGATGKLSVEEISEVVEQIQEEAAAWAINNVPPLRELEVSESRISEIKRRCQLATAGPWKVDREYVTSSRQDRIVSIDRAPDDASADLDFIAHSRLDLPHILLDYETILRILGDCEGVDAYSRGYE